MWACAGCRLRMGSQWGLTECGWEMCGCLAWQCPGQWVTPWQGGMLPCAAFFRSAAYAVWDGLGSEDSTAAACHVIIRTAQQRKMSVGSSAELRTCFGHLLCNLGSRGAYQQCEGTTRQVPCTHCSWDSLRRHFLSLSAFCCRAGVISEPECCVVDLSSDDTTLILASDGVFEFMSDEEVVDLVCNGTAADADDACAQVI